MRPVVRSALLAAAAVGVALAPSGAGAADATASAWWWRLQSGQLAPLPPPPGVEGDELFVQGSPDGASATAAVRFALDEGEVPATLQLRFADEGAGEAAAAATVLACPTTEPWNPGGNQAWDTMPVPDCNQQAVGAVSEDGSAMTFDLSALTFTDVVDLLIVAGQVEGFPEGANGSTFTLVFAPPEDTDLLPQEATSAGESPSSGTASSSSGSSGSATSPGAASSGSGSSSSGGSTSSGGSSSRPAPAAPTAPALPAGDVAAPATPAAPAAPGAAVPPFDPASTDSNDAKTLGIILLVGAALAGLVTSRKGPLLQLLGGVPANTVPAVAGLGRFAREREGTPPSLR